MRAVLTAVVAIALVAGVSDAASAASQKKRYSRAYKAKVYRPAPNYSGSNRKTFDETQYYERLLEKVPFGTGAWWRQRDEELGHN